MSYREPESPRERIMLEVHRLGMERHACAHCAALASQMVALLNILPPESRVSRREQYLEFLGLVRPEELTVEPPTPSR